MRGDGEKVSLVSLAVLISFTTQLHSSHFIHQDEVSDLVTNTRSTVGRDRVLAINLRVF